jgi:hypothetical protein
LVAGAAVVLAEAEEVLEALAVVPQEAAVPVAAGKEKRWRKKSN